MDNPNEKISENENNSQGQKPKTCKIAKLSLGLAVVGLPILVTFLLVIVNFLWFENLPEWFFVYYSILFFLIIYPLSVILGIVAIFKVRKSKGQLKGIRLAMGGMAINLATAVTLIATIIMFERQMMCGVNLFDIGVGIMTCALDNDGNYPTAEKWCDLLIEKYDIGPRQFICKSSDVVEGESSYAFNKNLAGKRIKEATQNVVLLFETNFGKTPVGRDGFIGDRDYNKALRISGPNRKVYKLRWNQVGGPEILTTDHHKGKGCWISFNSGCVQFVKTEKLKDLKWKPEETK